MVVGRWVWPGGMEKGGAVGWGGGGDSPMLACSLDQKRLQTNRFHCYIIVRVLPEKIPPIFCK